MSSSTHYVVIDINSGYIWGECHTETAYMACGIVDKEVDPGADYHYTEANKDDAGATYAVYELGAGHFDLLPNGFLGQDQDLIDAVEKFGKLDCLMTRSAFE